jgi:hypothetical protein
MKRIKHILNLIPFQIFILIGIQSSSQTSGSFSVGGAIDKYYPVTFADANWNSNIPTEVTIGRSNVHTDQTYRGAVMADFTYHVTNWGHGSDFIDANIHDYSVATVMVGGWQDVTMNNADNVIVIWLRGGTTTYYYTANSVVSPVVYDGVAHSLPYTTSSGTSYNLKTVKDTYVLSTGFNSKSARLEYLAVFGDIKSKKVKVTVSDWPDYVFEKKYPLPSLSDIEQFIQKNNHLPEVPSAKEVQEKGLDLGENQAILLKKIEELTLYIIEQDKRISRLETELKSK